MKSNYQNNYALYNHKYSVLIPDEKYSNRCFYYGDYQDVYDHYPPLSVAHMYTNIKANHMLVPSCNSCNSMLSNSMNNSLAERTRFVKGKLLKSIRKRAVWTDEDINQWKDESCSKKSDKSSLLLNSVIAYKNETAKLNERFNFEGYSYELNGERNTEFFMDNSYTKVFGEHFLNINHAISIISKRDRIPKKKLISLCSEGTPIEDAIYILKENKIKNAIIDKLAKENNMDKKDIVKIVNSIAKTRSITGFEALNFINK